MITLSTRNKRIPGPLIFACPRPYEVYRGKLSLCRWILNCLSAGVCTVGITDQLRVTGWKRPDIDQWLNEALRLFYAEDLSLVEV